MTTPRPPVLVLGSGLTVLGAIRLLGRAGFHPLVVSDDPGVARWSRWFRPAPRSQSSARPETDLPAWLNGLPLEQAVLLPCSDAWMLHVARCAAEVVPRFPTCISSFATLETLIDKWLLAGVLSKLGLPHPRTVSVDVSTNAAALAELAIDQAFIKPRDSARFFREFGVKAFRVSSREDLSTRLVEMTRRGLAVQLQEYVPGPAGNHFYVEGFIDRHGKRRALFVRQRLRMYPPDFGNSTLFESVAPSTVPDAVKTVRALLAHLEYRGIFSVEFKRDSRDGVCRLIEVNARPWWFVEFAGQCGVDLCAMSVTDALGQAVRDVTEYRVGKACVYPYYDFYACRALHAAGELSLAAWVGSWMSATQPVLRWSDPVPALAATVALTTRRLGRAFWRSG